MKRLLIPFLSLGLCPPAHASAAQYYVDKAAELMKQGHVHLERYVDSGEKDISEFAEYCRLGIGVLENIDSAWENGSRMTRLKLNFTKANMLERMYHKCGSYFPARYYGLCDNDFKNKECLGKPYF